MTSAMLATAFQLPTDRTVPADWPEPGPIDLSVRDRPHAASSSERWYLNCQLVTARGRDLRLFAVFTRQLVDRDAKTGVARYGHSVGWALSEPARRRCSYKVALDPLAPAFSLIPIELDAGLHEERLNRELRNELARGSARVPPESFETTPLVDPLGLHLDFDGDRLQRLGSGSYELELFDDRTRSACRLKFTPRLPALDYALDGVARGSDDEFVFYYFVSRCAVSGVVVVDGRCERLSSGSGSYDHEFAFEPEPPRSREVNPTNVAQMSDFLREQRQ